MWDSLPFPKIAAGRSPGAGTKSNKSAASHEESCPPRSGNSASSPGQQAGGPTALGKGSHPVGGAPGGKEEIENKEGDIA